MSKKRIINDAETVEESIVIGTQLDEEATCPTENEDPNYADLLETAKEIRKRKGVVGFIFKSDSKATVDIDDSAKIIEYAMLSSEAFESAKTLAATFKTGDTESILIEGKNLKVLCSEQGQNKISIFMEKSCDQSSILRDLTAQA